MSLTKENNSWKPLLNQSKDERLNNFQKTGDSLTKDKEMKTLEYDYESPGTPLRDNQRLSSELIEPFLKRFLMIQIEALAYGLHTPQQVRGYLAGVNYFVSCSCGLHAEVATNNMYQRLTSLSDEEMVLVSRKTFRDQEANQKSN
jgi:hypothetical protein